jgi:integrase
VSRRNHRTILHGLFEFAVTRRFIAKNPVRDTQKVTVRATDDVAIFTPSEFRALLNAASAAFLPVLVLGGFAGLRTAELERVTWENLDLEGGYITLTAKQAKNPSRRVIPLHPAAISWLRTVPRGEGRFWLNSVPFSIHAAQKQCAEAAGVTWQKNGLRHSYASYRLAIIGDPGRVAAEMGNSPAMVHRHYKQLVKPAEAEEWFAIVPEPKS